MNGANSEAGAGCGDKLEMIDVGARNLEKWAISSVFTELKAGAEVCALRRERAAARAKRREASIVLVLRPRARGVVEKTSTVG